MNPVELLQSHWRNALNKGDPNARYCTMATVETDSERVHARTRTLVLRSITNDHCVLYVNRRSQKNLDNLDSNLAELLLFYPTLMEQYRVRGALSFMNENELKNHWQHKPRGSKLLDLYYAEYQAQSSVLQSREAFEYAIKSLSERFPESDNIPYPSDAVGLKLSPDYIETWKADQNAFHKRELYKREGNQWSEETLVP